MPVDRPAGLFYDESLAAPPRDTTRAGCRYGGVFVLPAPSETACERVQCAKQLNVLSGWTGTSPTIRRCPSTVILIPFLIVLGVVLGIPTRFNRRIRNLTEALVPLLVTVTNAIPTENWWGALPVR